MNVESKTKPRILHISADYPDANRPNTTQAIKSFITLNSELDYFIVSLNRVANPFKCNIVNHDGSGDEKVVSIRYWGFPFGVFLALSMFIVALRIRKILIREKIKVDLLHAHKFTFEGQTAWWLSLWLRVPFFVSIRGEAESKILRFKPHYKYFLQKILNDTSFVFYVSAWFQPILNRHFQISDNKQTLLPNFIKETHVQCSNEFKQNHLVTVLNINIFRKKGLDKLLHAFASVVKSYPDAKLDIIGRGDPKTIEQVEAIIAKLELQNFVKLIGEVDNSNLLSSLSNYAGFVMPSHNETFGMVYLEALLCGIPILYSKNTGIDGFVDFIPSKVGVNPKSVESIAEGLKVLLLNQGDFRFWLKENHTTIRMQFDRKTHLQKYTKLVKGLLSCQKF